jgi:small subunit ribosomal protein S21
MASGDLVFRPNLFCFPFKSIWFLLKNLDGGFALPKVVLRDGESQQKLLGRFRKKVIRSGLMSEVRKRRWFVSKNEQRRMDDKKAIRRLKKRARKTHEYGN